MQVSDELNTKPEMIIIKMMVSLYWPRLIGRYYVCPAQSSPNIKLFNFLVLTNKSTKSFTLIG